MEETVERSAGSTAGSVLPGVRRVRRLDFGGDFSSATTAFYRELS